MTSKWTIAITGSRNFSNEDLIRQVLSEFPGKNILLTGACPTGADRIAEQYAEDMEWDIVYFPANWGKYGKRAAYIRNKMMIDSKPDIVLAFFETEPGREQDSKGTYMTMNLAKDANIRVEKYYV